MSEQDEILIELKDQRIELRLISVLREELKRTQAKVPGCSKPGCGYPDGKPCIGCGRIEYPHSAEQIQKLTQERDELISETADRETVQQELLQTLLASEKERDELKARLETLMGYVQHGPTCRSHGSSIQKLIHRSCDCGLSELLKENQAP